MMMMMAAGTVRVVSFMVATTIFSKTRVSPGIQRQSGKIVGFVLSVKIGNFSRQLLMLLLITACGEFTSIVCVEKFCLFFYILVTKIAGKFFSVWEVAAQFLCIWIKNYCLL